MARGLNAIIEAVLALPRAERAAVLDRLRESLEEPEVPGGIIVQPQDLVEYGARYVFPKNSRYRQETVRLTAKAGPTLSTTWGAIAIADPWFPEAAPGTPATMLGPEQQPTAVTTITRTRSDTGKTEVWPVAATIGDVAEVAVWHPLPDDGQFQLDSDSSLGAFYEITDAAALQPLFEDAPFMQHVFDRALEESIVPIEVDGRTLAPAFVCGKGLHPAWQGYDADMRAIAVLVDFGLLAEAQGRAEE